MTFSLNTKIVYPDNVNEIKNAIILLHGYGGDSNDISILTLSWKRFLPNTIFLCPNGHEPCSINPNGFQWFWEVGCRSYGSQNLIANQWFPNGLRQGADHIPKT